MAKAPHLVRAAEDPLNPALVLDSSPHPYKPVNGGGNNHARAGQRR